MDEQKLDEMRKLWNGKRGMAPEIVFANFKELKPFRAGKELTNSARSTFLSCQQKYAFSYIYGLAQRKTVIPFLVGGLFHDELDKMYSSGKLDVDAMTERVGEACEKACRYPGVSAEDSDKIWMQQAIVSGMVQGYEKLYFKKDLQEWEIVEAEGEFKAKLGDWTYRGKKDLVVKDKKTKKLMLVEHKTAGRLDANYVAKLPMDNQIIGYAWAQRASGGQKFSEVVYNVTKKPQIRQKQSESLREFNKRVENDYLLNPMAYFYRERLTFSDADLDRFEENLKDSVGEIERMYKRGKFTQNAGHCTAMGVCPFMTLCLDGLSKETLLNYRIKERAHEELPEAQGD